MTDRTTYGAPRQSHHQLAGAKAAALVHGPAYPARHPRNKTPTEYFYYVCQYNPKTPSHVAAAPDPPAPSK